MQEEVFDVAIVGAGAAGLMCAIEAGKRGRKTIVIEHNDRPGKKILISGGGRCNFTNLHIKPERFLSSNPEFCRSALTRYSQQDFIDLVRLYEIEYYEKTQGQLFCKDSAKQIVAMLLAECQKAGVSIRTSCSVLRIDRSSHYTVTTDNGIIESESLVVATGGLSIPTIGATGFGYNVARQFGLRVIEPKPGLVPLLYDHEDSLTYAELSGVSLTASVATSDVVFRDKLLFTHTGLSGPAVLQASSYWDGISSLNISLADDDVDLSAGSIRKHGGTALSYLRSVLPRRVANVWDARLGIVRSLSQLSDREAAMIGDSITNWNFTPTGSAGFAKAEVTVGGVDTAELSSKTMEARNVRGLFFVGEVMDVTGWLGGYNFQWAWSSGWAAGQVV